MKPLRKIFRALVQYRAVHWRQCFDAAGWAATAIAIAITTATI